MTVKVMNRPMDETNFISRYLRLFSQKRQVDIVRYSLFTLQFKASAYRWTNQNRELF